MVCYRRALELMPEFHAARIKLLHQLQHACIWGADALGDTLETHIRIVRQVVREEPVTPYNRISPFSFLALPGTTASEQKRCAEKGAQHAFQPLVSLREKLGFDFKREPGQKIHVGYLSADFHDHATMRLMAEVFELHDRSRFHITAYSSGPDNGSAMRARAKNAFDKFVDIRDDSLEGAARKIHADRIDILVDLKGYTQHSRSAILALRPAPVQVNYLGYPGTMGADFVDYLIADRFIIPPEHFEHYSEKVVWLPDCYQPNDRTRPRLAAPSRESCGLPDAGMVFCCFNQTYKITPEIFDVWCRLLQAVPGSVLWLLAKPHVEDNLRREAERRGVDPERLVMAPGLAPEKHLARLQCADLFLDTIPYNAHTTCSDALWMGLPVITCVGETFPSRVAGSLLTAMGMPELITYNLEDYYALALSLALDREKREGMRNKIIALRDTAPLFDSVRFTRNLEAVYEKMWEGMRKE
jgi:predicted O-linked N-acetylglucosamine transferase (SPINDLY family)